MRYDRRIEEIESEAIRIIKDELADHFGGGFEGERAIRDAEAKFVAGRIWQRLIPLLEQMRRTGDEDILAGGEPAVSG